MVNPSKIPNSTLSTPPSTTRENRSNESSHSHAPVKQPTIAKISEIPEDELSNYLFGRMETKNNSKNNSINKVNLSQINSKQDSSNIKSDNHNSIKSYNNKSNNQHLITIAEKKASFVAHLDNSASKANHEEFSKNIRKTPYIPSKQLNELEDDEFYQPDTPTMVPLKNELNSYQKSDLYCDELMFFPDKSDTLNISRSLNFDEIDHSICNPKLELEAEELLKKSPLFSDLFYEDGLHKKGDQHKRKIVKKKNKPMKIEMLRGEHADDQNILDFEISFIDNTNSFKFLEDDSRNLCPNNVDASKINDGYFSSLMKEENLNSKSNKYSQKSIEVPKEIVYKGNNTNVQMQKNSGLIKNEETSQITKTLKQANRIQADSIEHMKMHTENVILTLIFF